MLREDADLDVRSEAAIALGRYALEAELGHLYDSDREAIADILMESAEDNDEDIGVRAKAIEALGAISRSLIDNLIESIYAEDSMVLKIGAVDAMGRSCNDNWLPIVLKELEHRAPLMRHAAAFAAGEIGEEEACRRCNAWRFRTRTPRCATQRFTRSAQSVGRGPASR